MALRYSTWATATSTRNGVRPIVKVREILERLREDGWVVVRVKGSHRQLKHPARKGTVTVAGQPGMDLHSGTLKSILRQASWTEKEEQS